MPSGASIQGYIGRTDARPEPFVWTSSVGDILASIGRPDPYIAVAHS